MREERTEEWDQSRVNHLAGQLVSGCEWKTTEAVAVMLFMFCYGLFLRYCRDSHKKDTKVSAKGMADFLHVAVIWCKLLAWQDFSISSIWLNKHGDLSKRYRDILNYL